MVAAAAIPPAPVLVEGAPGSFYEATASPEVLEALAAVPTALARFRAEHRISADEFYVLMQGSARADPLPEMPHQEGQPPRQVNVYTDGSVSTPAKPWRAQMGVGVWAPVTSVPRSLAVNFHEMLWVAYCRDGLEVDTFLQGPYPSTTRAELFGLLIACLLYTSDAADDM
eukprot:15464612-Alexandrium_andersonii.AAC.1